MQQLRRTALVTGGSSGIGAAFVDRLAADGYDLVIVARDRERLDAVAARNIAAHGVTVEVICADLATDTGIDAVIARALVGVELLVLNAGTTLSAAVGETSDGDADRLVRLLATGVMRTCEAVVASMVTRGSGQVVVVSSIAAFTPMRKSAIYAASKSFATSYARSLDAEVARHGVRVLAVCPGYVRTPLHERAGLGHLSTRVPGFMWLEPDEVVDQSLRALRGRRAVLVPGLVYRIVRPFLGASSLQAVWRRMTRRGRR